MPIQIQVSQAKAQTSALIAKALVAASRQVVMPEPVKAAVRQYRERASGPFESLRPASNLYPREDFMHKVPVASKKNGKAKMASIATAGGLFFYNNGVKNPRAVWASLAVAIAYPNMQQVVPSRNDLKQKGYKAAFQSVSESWTASGLSSRVWVKKEADHLVAEVPIFLAKRIDLRVFRDLFAGRALTPDEDGTYPLVLDGAKEVPALEISPASVLFKPYLQRLRQIKDASVVVRPLGESFVFALHLTFTKLECEFLCQTKWNEIRPIDLYSMFRIWSDSRAGQVKQVKPPKYSLSLQQIADTLPEQGTPRLHPTLGLLVDQNANYWYFPKEANNIGRYDSGMAQSLTQSDGRLSMIDESTNSVAKLPANQLVFLDWVNLKYAFSNTEGRLTVRSLDRTKIVTETHIRRYLDTRLIKDEVRFLWASTWNLFSLIGGSLPGNLTEASALEARLIRDVYQGSLEGSLTLLDMYNVANVDPEIGEFKAACATLVKFAHDDFENLVTKYAVETVLQVIAGCTLFLEGANYEDHKAKDEQSRAVYQDQEVDPNHELDSVPYWREEDRFMLPHQARVANRLRGSPDFAILPVHAGGGKTSMAIYDVLKEMKSGRVKRALILCPSHLIAQYVKEFVDFCGGRVNTIVVNTYTMQTHKLEGLAKLIQSAPVNSIVFADYNLANGASKKIPMGYGGAPSTTFPVVEMLRRFSFDYVALDEAHYLKNATGRQAAIARLISDIPKKRLMSGTLTPNDVGDLVKQVEMLDPTIFGNQSNFLEDYALEIRGNKVISWKPGFEAAVMKRLKESVVWAPAKRKEWAAVLPPLVEEGEMVRLSAAQQACYQAILTSVVEEIKAAMMQNKKLRKLLEGDSKPSSPDDEDEDDEDDAGDEDINLDALLRPYLQRLEIFVAAPGADPLGSKTLQGADLVSPKVGYIAKVCDEHLAQGLPGKILIFTCYNESAKAIYENLPPHLKEQTIYYTAGQKAECAAKFENDPKMKIMVGVEVSMNTGLNLQFASRLIRSDSVWTPGALEQGNSRVQRPNLKAVETRDAVYINWVACDFTIDVTKMAYLLAKRVTIGKFEEAGNPLYDNVIVPPKFSMKLETIEDANAANGESLTPYFEAYQSFKAAQVRDFAQYRRDHPEDLGPDGTIRKDPVARGPNLPDSKFMYRLPYVPGTELYKATDLGLIRYDQFMLLNEQDLEDDGEDGDDADVEAGSEERDKAIGMGVHTEYGDGTITRVTKKRVTVEFSDGTRRPVHKLAAFVITRSQTNSKDMRSLLLQQNGDIPFDRPIELQVKDARDTKIPKGPSEVQDDRIPLEFVITIVNDFVGLEFQDATSNKPAARALEALGFKQPAPYYYAAMRDAAHMYQLFKKWHESGIKVSPGYSAACRDLYTSLKNSRKNAATLVGQATAADLRNFFRLNIKPVPDANTCCPYPMVQDDVIYIALPKQGHPGSRTAMRVKVPGVTWMEADTENTLGVYFPSLHAFNRNMQKLIARNTFVITNIADLRRQAKRLHRRSPALIEGTRE